MINKTDYIIKHLSRTKRKDYENYIINRLWHKLDDNQLKPVAQQYVSRNNGYALIDLYFPQLNIGIECDEKHHDNQLEEDRLRFEDILLAIKGYEEVRIPVTKNGQTRSIEEIDVDIDAAIERIRNKKQELVSSRDFYPWGDKSDLDLALENGKISVDDSYTFFNQEEVRNFFGRDGKAQQAFYKIKENGDHIWLPALAIEKDGKYISYKRQVFINIFEDDKDGKGTKVIWEYLPNYNPSEEKTEKFNRIVFAKKKDTVLGKEVIVFLGVFSKTTELMTREIDGINKVFVKHQQISDFVDRD